MSELPRRYVIKDAVVDGKTYKVPNGMSSRFKECYIHLQFFSDEKFENEVRPTGGTAKIQLSPDGSNFYDLDAGGTIDLSTMYSPSYTIPSAASPAEDGSITLTSVVGTNVNYFKATFERF